VGTAAEIAAILKLARECDAAGLRSALAHLVSVEGSHYRRPGARMLLAEDGRSAGAISAGCLESDLRQRLPETLARGHTDVLAYDSRTFEDLVWGLGSGCNGLVRVLLSPFSGTLREVHEQAGSGLARGEAVRLATVLAGAEGSKRSPGEVLLLRPGETPAESGVEFFVEEIAPAISLLIAGAGPDAAPLARLAALLGWQVSILSARDRTYVLNRFRGLDVMPVGGPENAAEFSVHARTAAVIMSHGFTEDAAALQVLLSRGLPYLGVLGPRERTRRLLAACGAPAGAAEKIHSPVGLNVGAETAEEIALSIVAEIQAALSA
jgi:xanthine/CO dehydrogenase XdhC/CoxF family maturation factor